MAVVRATWSDEKREAEAVKQRGRKLARGYTDAQRSADQRRRARKKDARVETFTAAEVYERDAWTCGICQQCIDPDLAHPDPRSVSLDHVVPLSLGGEHSRANSRAAHLACNVRRGARA